MKVAIHLPCRWQPGPTAPVVEPPPGPLASRQLSRKVRAHDPLHRFRTGSGKLLLELYVMNLLYVDVAVLLARRGLPRPSAVNYLFAPLPRSNTGRGEEDLMNFTFMDGAPPWQA